MRLQTIFLVGWLLAVPSLSAEPLQKITWLISDTPPFFVNNGQWQHRGTCDQLMNALQRAMPDIEHQTELIPQVRVGRLMADGEKVCFPCKIYQAANPTGVVLSNPGFVYPPFVIVTNTEQAKRIRDSYREPIDITELLKDDRFQFGREKARRYGEVLQPLLEQSWAYSRGVINSNFAGSSTAMFELLGHKRIDYFVDYPVTAFYHQKLGFNDIVLLPIAQVPTQPIRVAVGCSAAAPDDFAQKAVARINAALHDVVLADQRYIVLQGEWVAPYLPEYAEHMSDLKDFNQ